MDYSTIIAPLVAALLRNISGWAESALKDGVVSKYEWCQLGSTVIRVGVLTATAQLGFNLPPESAAAIGIFADLLISKLAKSIKEKDV